MSAEDWRGLFSSFIDPSTKESVVFADEIDALLAKGGYFLVEDGVVDFYERLSAPLLAGSRRPAAVLPGQSGLPGQSLACPDSLAAPYDTAPELRAAHETAFRDAAESGGNIYGRLEDLPLIAQSGHYRRMELLSLFDLGDIGGGIAVDFGTGPWGFGAIFPRLRNAGKCIGFDVSAGALRLARKATPAEMNHKTIYATSDGDVIPLANESVDLFFGGEVIEHVRNPFVFMQEIARVCRENAIVILTTPNRDVFAYKTQNIRYCTGPEHIALLNHSEYGDLLERFCNEVEIYGYETSIGPDADHFQAPQEDLALLQARAHRFPQLATGLISCARVAKDKLEKHGRHFSLIETGRNSDRLSYSAQGEALHLFDEVHGTLLAEGSEVTFRRTGQMASILFWGHDWSGIADIRCGSQTISQDLYAPRGGFIRVNLDGLPFPSEIVIRRSGRKRDVAKSDQVIFYKVIEYA